MSHCAAEEKLGKEEVLECSPDIPSFTGEGDVVIDELAPNHEEDRHRVVVETLVLEIRYKKLKPKK